MPISRLSRTLLPLVLVVTPITTGPILAQQTDNGARPTVTPDDYGKWERLGAGSLSPDGRWLAYGISRVNEENELRVRLIDRDSLVTVPYARRPAFSDEGGWLAFEIGVSEEERERREKSKTPVRSSLGLLNLQI